MPILAIFTGKMNQKKYDELGKEVKWETNNPEGALFHAAAFEGENFHVVDVWASADAMGKFFETRLKPAFKKLGIAEPTAKVLPAYSVFPYKGLKASKG